MELISNINSLYELSENKLFRGDINRLEYLRNLDKQKGYDYLDDDYLVNVRFKISSSILYFTPIKIANDMLDLLPTDIWSNPDIKILNICDKSGVFNYLAYIRFMIGLKDRIPDIKKRRTHILLFQLYSIAMDEKLGDNIGYVYNGHRIKDGSNILTVGDYDEYISFMRGNIDVIKNRLMEEFNTMEFDIVVGNPPYNKGMDLDFVNLGFEISSKYCLMVTPAKWQTAEDNQKISSRIGYGEFRDKLVPHMSHIVFYPDCFDVFDIQQKEGITYFLVDKSSNNICWISNLSILQPRINSKMRRSISNGETLWNVGYEVLRSIGEYNRYKFNNNKNGKFKVYTGRNFSHGGGHLASGGGNLKGTGTGGYIFTLQGNLNCISNSKIVNPGDTDIQKYTTCTFTSDNIEECKSFVSWINTKFTRFFVLIGLGKRDIQFTDYGFRFVPAPTVLDANGNRIPGKFDHIYTDEELYKTFNLPQEYIDVIEAVIKERKQ